jgi:hypothetical protein
MARFHEWVVVIRGPEALGQVTGPLINFSSISRREKSLENTKNELKREEKGRIKLHLIERVINF